MVLKTSFRMILSASELFLLAFLLLFELYSLERISEICSHILFYNMLCTSLLLFNFQRSFPVTVLTATFLLYHFPFALSTLFSTFFKSFFGSFEALGRDLFPLSGKACI